MEEEKKNKKVPLNIHHLKYFNNNFYNAVTVDRNNLQPDTSFQKSKDFNSMNSYQYQNKSSSPSRFKKNTILPEKKIESHFSGTQLISDIRPNSVTNSVTKETQDIKESLKALGINLMWAKYDDDNTKIDSKTFNFKDTAYSDVKLLMEEKKLQSDHMHNYYKNKSPNDKNDYKLAYNIKHFTKKISDNTTPQNSLSVNNHLNNSISSNNVNSIQDCSNLPLGI